MHYSFETELDFIEKFNESVWVGNVRLRLQRRPHPDLTSFMPVGSGNGANASSSATKPVYAPAYAKAPTLHKNFVSDILAL